MLACLRSRHPSKRCLDFLTVFFVARMYIDRFLMNNALKRANASSDALDVKKAQTFDIETKDDIARSVLEVQLTYSLIASSTKGLSVSLTC